MHGVIKIACFISKKPVTFIFKGTVSISSRDLLSRALNLFFRNSNHFVKILETHKKIDKNSLKNCTKI